MLRPLPPIALILLLAAPAPAEELSGLAQSAVATPARTEADHDLGIDLLWLPVESRSSVTDFVARNHPGAQLNREGHLEISGGHPRDVALEVDGYRFTNLTPPLELLDGFAVANAGYGAAWNDSAGVIAASTRAGGNRPQAALEVHDDLHDLATKSGALALSAPIVRDRLFAIAAVRDDLIERPGAIDPSGITLNAPGPNGHVLSAGLKLIWQPAANHRVESLTLFQDGRLDNIASLGIEPQSEPTYGTREVATGLRWLGRFGARVTASSQAAVQVHRDEEMPLRCRTDGAACESVVPVVQTAPPAGSAAANIVQTTGSAIGWGTRHAGRRSTASPSASSTAPPCASA